MVACGAMCRPLAARLHLRRWVLDAKSQQLARLAGSSHPVWLADRAAAAVAAQFNESDATYFSATGIFAEAPGLRLEIENRTLRNKTSAQSAIGGILVVADQTIWTWVGFASRVV